MNNNHPKEIFFSVDVETAGPNPSQYSLLSIGACTILSKPESSFYIELQPVNDIFTPQAFAVHRLSLERLAERGTPPAEAMKKFAAWIEEQAPEGSMAVFVAFNAPFDWMFVNDYFMRFLDYNPFGHAALDIKSYYMGLTGVSWAETSMRHVSPRYLGSQPLTHHALRDALDQATIFKKMLSEAQDDV